MNPDLNGSLTATTLFNKHLLVAAGTQTGAGVDLTGYVGNLLIVLSAAGANGDNGATVTYSLLDSADNTTFAFWQEQKQGPLEFLRAAQDEYQPTVF